MTRNSAGSLLALAVPLALAATLAACGSSAPRLAPSPAAHVAAEPSPSCVVRSAATTTPESLVIAIESRADFRPIRVGARFGDRFLSAQPYETLVRVDCEGRLYAGLASDWHTDASGERLLFHLREGARFWNGDAVRAGDVLAAWNAVAARSAVAHDLLPRSVVVDDSTLGIAIPADTGPVSAGTAVTSCLARARQRLHASRRFVFGPRYHTAPLPHVDCR